MGLLGLYGGHNLKRENMRDEAFEDRVWQDRETAIGVVSSMLLSLPHPTVGDVDVSWEEGWRQAELGRYLADRAWEAIRGITVNAERDIAIGKIQC